MNSVAELLPKSTTIEKDGEDGEANLYQIVIEIGQNGYVVTYNYDSGDDLKFVFSDFNDALKHIRSFH